MNLAIGPGVILVVFTPCSCVHSCMCARYWCLFMIVIPLMYRSLYIRVSTINVVQLFFFVLVFRPRPMCPERLSMDDASLRGCVFPGWPSGHPWNLMFLRVVIIHCLNDLLGRGQGVTQRDVMLAILADRQSRPRI
jgi:hypothetical protein